MRKEKILFKKNNDDNFWQITNINNETGNIKLSQLKSNHNETYTWQLTTIRN